MTSPFRNVGFWLFPQYLHLWYLVSRFGFTDIAIIFFNKLGGFVEVYKRVKSRHGIGLQSTCEYQNCVEKEVLFVKAMFDQSFFVMLVIHSTLRHFLLEILSFHLFDYFGRRYNKDKNYDCDKYFSIFKSGKTVRSCDETL